MKLKSIHFFGLVLMLGLVASVWAGAALAERPVSLPDPLPELLQTRCQQDWTVPINAAAAEAYGLTEAEIVAALHNGAVLAELADSPAEIARLEAALIRLRAQKIDEAVEAEVLTGEQAAKLKAALPVLTGQLLENGGGPYWGNGLAGGRRWGSWRDDVAAYLELSIEELAVALDSGQSLGEITEAQGLDVAEVVNILLANAENKIEQAVENDILNQEQADRILEFLEANMTILIYSNGPCSLDLEDLQLDETGIRQIVQQKLAANL